ncbi:DUF309 domain-containing protein [Synechococcus sp. PCC 6312]|uniref:DUF309 domain-containing protein n=1 Tax=Synechococcus sp. (strain ATCC 27167 / PCC 6312) TaxID=195253 RepID=UPI00209FEB02|nr:DUF309 domain-containing protein [Synechococcus sp. PCC 6312]
MRKPIVIRSVNELSPQVWQAVLEFNQGEFYACHDTLEALWAEAREPERTFFQGILQLAVACYHLQNQNQRGAVLLLAGGCRRLNQYWPAYGWVDVASLVEQAQALLECLQTNQPPQAWPKLHIVTLAPISPSVGVDDGFDGE